MTPSFTCSLNRTRLLFALALALATLGIGCGPSESWHKAEVHGRTIWQSDSGKWRAEVDPSRGRLTYLGPRNGPNFLNAPANPENSLQFGGHRVWLGPQRDWKPFWPPPSNWEMVSAHTVKLIQGNILELESPTGKGNAVALRRTYRWQGKGQLECSVSWEEKSSRGHQVIQIFQLAEGVVFAAEPRPTAAFPLGFVRLPIGPRRTLEAIFALPPQATIVGDSVQLRRKSEEEKLGFPTQTLSARWPQGELLLHPGHFEGRVTDEPDSGFNSQIYLGRDEVPQLEFEQVSPRLVPNSSGGRVSHSILIELRNP